jgi:hypothetical protein
MGVIAQRAALARELLHPWSGLLGGAFGWFLTHQIGSTQSFDDCRNSGAVLITIIGIVGLLLAAGGGWVASLVWRDRGPSHGARHFIAATGGAASALFAIAIVLQTSAALIIPRCFG